MNSTVPRQVKPLSHQLFTGECSEEYNALRSAFRTAAENSGESGEYAEYDWLETVPRTSMTVELVDALHEHGYAIKRVLSEADGQPESASGVSLPKEKETP